MDYLSQYPSTRKGSRCEDSSLIQASADSRSGWSTLLGVELGLTMRAVVSTLANAQNRDLLSQRRFPKFAIAIPGRLSRAPSKVLECDRAPLRCFPPRQGRTVIMNSQALYNFTHCTAWEGAHHSTAATPFRLRTESVVKPSSPPGCTSLTVIKQIY